jgi:tRNA pseudouridine55 synthase
MIHGWLLIDKELYLSSAKVVAKVKNILAAKKVGHAGTLDPLASGLMLIALGEATKLSAFALNYDKEYEFTIKFGSSTTTDDAEGEVLHQSDFLPSYAEILDALQYFSGNIKQAPPIYSAIHVAGKRAYALARENKISELPQREVYIKEITLKDYASGEATLTVNCSKGTYVRALARDISLKLGTFGHVIKLRRTRIGKFLLSDAISLDKLKDLVHNAQILKANRNTDLFLNAQSAQAVEKYLSTRIHDKNKNSIFINDEYSKLLSVNIVLDDIPVLEITQAQKIDLTYGRAIAANFESEQLELIQAIDDKGKLVSLGKYYNKQFKPIRIFNY